jgi:hypothetical protein
MEIIMEHNDSTMERRGDREMGKRTSRIENIIITIFMVSILTWCWHLTFKEGGAWDYNMEQVLK